MKSHVTRDFRLCFAQLPDRIQRLAKSNYRLWTQSPHHPSLAFKRVGQRYPTYSIRVGLGWRALGFKEEDVIVWFWIGPHSEYERMIREF